MRYIYNGKSLCHSVEGLQHLKPASRPVNDPHKYGLPKLKKYPMPDARHVKSAIKFFNYVDPANEKELADAILARIEEYNIGSLNVGPSNRFKKYYKPRADNEITVIKHSAGPWENHNYLDKVKIGDTWRYIYDQGQQVGTKLNQVTQAQQPNMETVNKVQEAAHNKAVKIQTNLKSALDRTVSELTGINNSSMHSKNHGTVTKKNDTNEKPAAEETEVKTDAEKKSGKSGGKGLSKKKSSGSYSNPMKGVNPGHASGGKSSSGSSGSSSGSNSDTEKESAKKAKIDSKLKKEQEDKKREAEEARRKQQEEFDKRREANAKKAAAEEEVSKRRNSTDSTTVDNSALESIIEMLDDSNKEKVKKLLETKSPSKIQEYLDYTKDKMSSDKKNYNNWKSENEYAEGMRDTARTTVNNKTLDRILEMLDESKKKQAQRILDGKNKLDDLLDELRKHK